MPSALTFGLKYVYRWGNVKQREMASSDVFAAPIWALTEIGFVVIAKFLICLNQLRNENAAQKKPERKTKITKTDLNLRKQIKFMPLLNLIYFALIVSGDWIWSSMWDFKFTTPTSLCVDRLQLKPRFVCERKLCLAVNYVGFDVHASTCSQWALDCSAEGLTSKFYSTSIVISNKFENLNF